MTDSGTHPGLAEKQKDWSCLLKAAQQCQSRLLTISCHGSYIRPIHDTLVLLSQCFDVPLAEIEDLLAQHGAVLVASSLLDGEMQQHHAPDEAEADEKEAQLLG